MPCFTVQWGRYFSLACFCLASSCSGVSFLRSGSSTRPCQLVRSLPLNRAVKPGGGVLSFGPAFSSAFTAGARTMIAARLDNACNFMMLSRGTSTWKVAQSAGVDSISACEDSQKNKRLRDQHKTVNNNCTIDPSQSGRTGFLVQSRHADQQPDRIEIQQRRQDDHAEERSTPR